MILGTTTKHLLMRRHWQRTHLLYRLEITINPGYNNHDIYIIPAESIPSQKKICEMWDSNSRSLTSSLKRIIIPPSTYVWLEQRYFLFELARETSLVLVGNTNQDLKIFLGSWTGTKDVFLGLVGVTKSVSRDLDSVSRDLDFQNRY